MSQLYFLELLIGQLNLEKQIIKDAGDDVEFVIKVKVIDFPAFEINRRNVPSADVTKPDFESRLDFRAGRACHFTTTGEKMVNKILRTPLSVKIFRRGDSIPSCIAELPLSGCLCDQAKTTADDLRVPEPYVFGGVINLFDIGGNPSGNVDINLKITCCGKYVLTSYVLADRCFHFKKNNEGAEFRVTKSNEGAEKRENGRAMDIAGRQLDWENLMGDLAGIFPSAERLCLGKPPRRLPRVPLTIEAPAPLMETKDIKKEKKLRKKERVKKK